MRHPYDIAADIIDARERAALWAVPRDIAAAVDLLTEFAASVAATLQAAQLAPPHAPDSTAPDSTPQG